MTGDRVYRMPDGVTVLGSQVVAEVERVAAVASANDRIDAARREFDDAVMEKVLMFEMWGLS